MRGTAFWFCYLVIANGVTGRRADRTELHGGRIQMANGCVSIVLASKRGDLVAIANAEKEMTDPVITTKARILSVPARVTAHLVGENSRVMAQAKVEEALKEALSHLAER